MRTSRPIALVTIHGVNADPHQARYVRIDGALSWHGFRLSCEQCGSGHGWRLFVQQERRVDGQRAWAQCPQGHVTCHPLIYPAFVTALVDWSNIPEETRPPVEAAFPDWRPHIEHRRDLGDEVSSDFPTIVCYEPWDELPPAARAERWPTLYAAYAVA